MPPFRSTKKAGLVAGEGIGACIPWLKPVPTAAPDPGGGAADEPGPAAPAASA